MGGVVDRGGGGVDTNLPPQLAEIEEARAELRQHYFSYDEAKRELDFLEKGGDPLDFKPRNAASLSVQSTSLLDQHPEQFVTSEAKGNFASAASPPGDSVESSGRPGAPPAYEPNSADNLLLFDGENDFPKGERDSVHSGRGIIGQNAKELSHSAAFGLPRKAYKRRNRSRPNRDGARSSYTDVGPSLGVHASIPSHHSPMDAKGLAVDADNQKDPNVSSNFNLSPTSPSCSIGPRVERPDSPLNLELDGLRAVESTMGLTRVSLSDSKTDANASNSVLDNHDTEFPLSDTRRTSIDIASGKPESLGGSEQIALAIPERLTEKVEDQVTSSKINGFNDAKGDRKITVNEGQNSKALDSESLCTQTGLSLDGNIDTKIFTNLGNGGSNGNATEEIEAFEKTPTMVGDKSVEQNNETKAIDICPVVTNDNSTFFHKSNQENGSILKNEEALKEKVSNFQNVVKDSIAIGGMEPDGRNASEKEREPSNLLGFESTHENENVCVGRPQGSLNSSTPETPDMTLTARVSAVSSEHQACSPVTSKMATKANEDSILEEARIIEAKRKRISELSIRALPPENRQKSQWDFVLEEMAWLANDFAQERLWKITAAAQIGCQAASASRLKFQEQKSCQKQREVAHKLAKSVMDFWHRVEETSKEQELKNPGKDFEHAVLGYASRFLNCNNNSDVQYVQAESPMTTDRMSDLGILDISWELQSTEESLFYSVPAGAMEAYKKSIESHLLRREKTGSSMQEEVETSGYDGLADFGSQENAFEDDEGETSTYYLPGSFDKSSKFAQKKLKHQMKAATARPSYGLTPDSQFMQNHRSVIIGKRPANTVSVLIPTKRMRTGASRQRVPSPFNTVTSGCVLAPNKTDASSGDTNSFQDDQTTLQGGTRNPNSLEVQSVRKFEKQLPFESAEISHQPKKRKKGNFMGSTYDYRWQMDSDFQNEQRENPKRRLESRQLESNGNSGLYGQHNMKRPKMVKQSLDNSVDILTPIGGSVPSPVASQMSNMSNPSKFMKMLGGRDRGRKNKSLKMPAGQPGSGSPWSLFEDQALVVLVHDMGPNWELVSDAINSTLQFKCILRKPNECKERHKVLMDSPAGDGADSAEDSGSSQPYRSTLPGIPKGSARQLFQRLQGPMEENMIKSHFEKIILIGKKQHHRRSQEPKQIQQPHNSHALALSQVCPNNMSGGPVLTPLDLCDATASSPDVLSLGYQSPHPGGLPISNQGSVAPMLPPASGGNPSVQASLGSNFSPSGPLSAPARDGRFGIPRSAASLSIEEQQRMQQYNQMLSGRNNMPPVPGVHPGTDRTVRMLPGGNGVGVALNRSMPMSRPAGLQGIASSAMINSGSMVSSSGMVAMASPVNNIHSGPAAAGQGNSMMRPRDALHMMRPPGHQHPEQQRQQTMVSEISQGNSPGVSPSVQSYHQQQPHSHLQGGTNTTQQQQHQQAYAIRLAKERHIQQQQLLQQQQLAAASSNNNALTMPNLPPPHIQQGAPQSPKLPPLSSSSQNTTSLSPLTTSSSSMTPMLQKSQMTPHGVVARNPQVGASAGGGLAGGKPRQRQPQFQQPNNRQKHPPLQRQQQSQQAQQQQQAAKVILKSGVGGRGKNINMMLQQNQLAPSMDNNNALLNNGSLPITSSSGNQSSAEKGEQHMIQGQSQGLYSAGPGGLNSVQTPKQLVPPNQAQPQQKRMHPGQTTVSSKKQVKQIPASHPDNNGNKQPVVAAGPPTTSSSSVQAVTPPVVIPSSNQQQQQLQPQPHPKLVNQTQPTTTVQRLPHQNRQVNSDPPNKLPQASLQHSVENSSHMGTTGCVDASAPQHKASAGPVNDSSIPNHATQVGPVGSSPPSINSGSEPHLPSVSQDLSQKQSSGSFSCIAAHAGGGIQERSQQSSQLQLPTTLSRPLQQEANMDPTCARREQ